MIKWPDDPRLPPEVRERLEERVAHWLSEDTSADGAKNGESAQELILDLYAIYSSGADADSEGLRQLELILTGVDWDTDEPRHAHAQKYINRLFANDPTAAYAYIDKAVNQQESESATRVTEAIALTGALGGKAKHRETTAAKEKALEFYALNHAKFSSKKAAAKYLEQHYPPVKYLTYYRLLRKP